MQSSNDYSSDWFDIFLDTYPEAYTLAEVEFIKQFLPQPAYTRLLDICCGRGRHARLLASSGYKITGIDINPDVIAEAQKLMQDRTQFLVHDMRQLEDLPEEYDAMINMWQSFGYFDEATNTQILNSTYKKLKPNGRLIIDVYNRDHFVLNCGEKQFERGGKRVTERKTLTGKRLHVELDYEGSKNADTFSWHIYTPGEFQELTDQIGFETLALCTIANINIAPSADYPRMQFVLQKR